MTNLQQRIITSIFFVSILLSGIYFGPFYTGILFVLINYLCLNEFYHFFKLSETKPQKNLGLLFGFAFFVVHYLNHEGISEVSSSSILLPALFIIPTIELYRKSKKPIQNIALTILGIFYVTVPFSMMFSLGYFEGNSFGQTYHPDIILGFFFMLWANDTGAYFSGRLLGKRKLFERISPNKTWEGFIGGSILALLVAGLNASLFPIISLPIWLGIGLITFAFASLGDLVESMFKRSLGIKDSGTILPGHGGVLDRFDGVFIAIPIIYLFLQVISLF